MSILISYTSLRSTSRHNFYFIFYSINILKRQTAASKLESCYCEGTEDFDCVGIKMNMEELCFSTKNEIDDIITKSSASVKDNYKIAIITLITAAPGMTNMKIRKW